MNSVVRCIKYSFRLTINPPCIIFRRNFSKIKQFCPSKYALNRQYNSIYKRTAQHILNYSTQSEMLERNNDEDDFYKNIDYEGLTKGDEALLKKLKVLILEAEVMRQEGLKVPSHIKTEHWAELLTMKTKSQRLKHLAFLAQKERLRESGKRKKEKKKLERVKEREKKDEEMRSNDHLHYGFGGSTVFIRIYDTKIDMLSNSRLIQAMQFGLPLILDCGYDKHMNLKESSNCARQLAMLFSDNRKNIEPFNIFFCNANRNSNVMMKLKKHIPTMFDESFPMNITEKSYLDLFPKERLVYLTPHCRNDITEFSYDDIYIIGAMVDKVTQEPLSLAKAKSEGLRMARLPLDRYLDWSIGTKSLTINQMVSIMLDLKDTRGDWSIALRHVPSRKISKEAKVDNILKSDQGLVWRKGKIPNIRTLFSE